MQTSVQVCYGHCFKHSLCGLIGRLVGLKLTSLQEALLGEAVPSIPGSMFVWRRRVRDMGKLVPSRHSCCHCVFDWLLPDMSNVGASSANDTEIGELTLVLPRISLEEQITWLC